MHYCTMHYCTKYNYVVMCHLLRHSLRQKAVALVDMVLLGGRRSSPSAVCHQARFLFLGSGVSDSPAGSVPPSLDISATRARCRLSSVEPCTPSVKLLSMIT